MHGYNKFRAANAVAMVFVGMAIGGPFLGWLADYLGKRRPLILLCAVLEVMLVILVLYDVNLSYPSLDIALFLFGFFASCQILIYGVSCDHAPADSSGFALSFTNMIVMFYGIISQPFVGGLLDIQANASSVSGVGLHYTAGDYQRVMLIMPVSLLIALLGVWYLKEKTVAVDLV